MVEQARSLHVRGPTCRDGECRLQIAEVRVCEKGDGLDDEPPRFSRTP